MTPEQPSPARPEGQLRVDGDGFGALEVAAAVIEEDGVGPGLEDPGDDRRGGRPPSESGPAVLCQGRHPNGQRGPPRAS